MTSEDRKSCNDDYQAQEVTKELYFQICKEHERRYEVLMFLFCKQVEKGDTTCDEVGLENTRKYLRKIEDILSMSYFTYYGFGDQDNFENFLKTACMYCVKHYPVPKENLDSVIYKL